MPETPSPHPVDDQISEAPGSPRAVSWVLALSSDIAAIVFTTSLLWLGSGGVSVFAGSPMVLAIAFVGGVALAGTTLISIRKLASTRTGEALRAGAVIMILVAAYVMLNFVFTNYFFAWMLLFAGAFFAARESVLIVVSAFRGREPGAAWWRAVTAASGIVVVTTLSPVWQGDGLLADLMVFVLLTSIAAMVLHAISSAARAPSRPEVAEV